MSASEFGNGNDSLTSSFLGQGQRTFGFKNRVEAFENGIFSEGDFIENEGVTTTERLDDRTVSPREESRAVVGGSWAHCTEQVGRFKMLVTIHNHSATLKNFSPTHCGGA